MSDSPVTRPAPPPTETLREALPKFERTEDVDADCFVDGKPARIHYFVGCTPAEVAKAEAALAALSCVEALVRAVGEDVSDYLEWRSIPGNEHKSTPVMDNLVDAYRPFSVAAAERQETP